MQIVDLVGHEFEEFKRRLAKTSSNEASPLQVEARMILTLLDYLDSKGPEPRVFAMRMLRNEIWLSSEAVPGGLITLWVDYNDWDRERRLHYRLSFKPHDSALSTDLRTSEPAEVERFILECIAHPS